MSVRLLGFLYSTPTDDFRNLSPAWQVMNEVALHRGSSPHLNTIDIFVDGQHLTEAVVSHYHVVPFLVLHLLVFLVRRCHCFDSNRLNGVLVISGRPHRPPFTKCARPNAHMSTESFFPTLSIPILVLGDSPCKFYAPWLFNMGATNSFDDILDR